ncbi:hypothetical protein ECDEC6D_1315 [Escherichia coli DEC6D]|nr:hypothetical protein ECDEC6D_1315 [Escherichia coli DEC6D]
MNTETLCEISAHHFPTIIVKRSKLLIAAFFSSSEGISADSFYSVQQFHFPDD